MKTKGYEIFLDQLRDLTVGRAAGALEQIEEALKLDSNSVAIYLNIAEINLISPGINSPFISPFGNLMLYSKTGFPSL